MPLKTAEEILTNAGDEPALLLCLLVSQGFEYSVARALRKTIALHGKQLQAFRRAIDANPPNPQHASRLRRLWCTVSAAQPYHNLHYILFNLPSLRTLNMSAVS